MNSTTTPTVHEKTGAVIVTVGNEVWAPIPKAKTTYIPLVCDVVGTVNDAADTARTVIAGLDLFPGTNDDLFSTIAEITAWAEDHQAPDLLDLAGDTAALLICDLTGIGDLRQLTAAMPPAPAPGQRRPPVRFSDLQAEAEAHRVRAHHVRYALTAMRGAVVWTRSRNRRERLLDDSLASGLPDLPNLEDRKSRPLTDDEILLARLLLEINCSEGELPRPSLVYLLAETGIRLIESTALETDNLDHPAQPRTITALGAWRKKDTDAAERTVTLTDYAAKTMPGLLKQLRPGTQPLTYTGGAPGTGASTASAFGVLMRHLRRAGITDTDITPKSVCFWRPMRALLADGDMVQARSYHGGATKNLEKDLALTADKTRVATDRVVDLYRERDGAFIATIPVSDYNDGSVTLRKWRAGNESV